MAPFGATTAENGQHNSSALTNESGPHPSKTPPATPLKSSRGLPSPGETTVQKTDQRNQRARRRRKRRNKRRNQRARRRKAPTPPSPPTLRTIQTEPPETGVLRPKAKWNWDPRFRSAWWTSPERVALPRPQVDLLGRIHTDGAGRAYCPSVEIYNWKDVKARLGNIRAGKRAWTPKRDLTKKELHTEWRAGWRRPTPLPTSIVVLGPANQAYLKGVKKVDVKVAFVQRIAIKNAMSAELSRG